MAERKSVTHEFELFCPEDAELLILGSIPSPKSRAQGFYYGHPQNRFWKVLAGVFAEETPRTIDEKKTFLRRQKIALWDVLYSCTIEGAQDGSIREPVPNDLRVALNRAPIRIICTTGKTAYDLFQKQWGNSFCIPVYALPSTSPANCRVSLEELIRIYGGVLKSVNLSPDR